MTLCLSERSALIEHAEIRAMSLECDRIGGINLAQGVCDTGVPEAVSRGVGLAVEMGFNSYTNSDGLPQIREAIARKLREYNGIGADPETDIIVSAGSTGAFYCACFALLDPGDEVILFEPYYAYHVNTLLAVSAVPRFISLVPPEWTFSLRQLEAAVGPRTKAIVVNTPSNPSGKVFLRKELESIAELAIQRDLFVFTDEIYEHFLYDGRVHLSPASIAGMAERTITISGFSKTMSITGWRIGYSVSAAQWARKIGQVNDLIYVCAPSPLQYAVALGLPHLDADFYRRLASVYARKRERLCSTLSLAGLCPFVPPGAYYVLADASRLPGENSKERAMFLLARTGVSSVPGRAFFNNGGGDTLLRFCFAKTDAELEEACERLRQVP